MCAKPVQSCPTLCDPVDCSLPDAPVHWILQQGYWSGLPCPPPGDPPRPEIEAASRMFPALTGGFFTPSGTWETQHPGDHVLKDSKLLFQFPPVSPVPDRTQSGNRPPQMQGQFPRWCYFSNHAKEHSVSLTKMNPVQVIIRREF